MRCGIQGNISVPGIMSGRLALPISDNEYKLLNYFDVTVLKG
jgi:hypothetical protein